MSHIKSDAPINATNRGDPDANSTKTSLIDRLAFSIKPDSRSCNGVVDDRVFGRFGKGFENASAERFVADAKFDNTAFDEDDDRDEQKDLAPAGQILAETLAVEDPDAADAIVVLRLAVKIAPSAQPSM